MKAFCTKASLGLGFGIIGGSIVPVIGAPITGAFGVCLGEYLFDENKEELDPEKIVTQYGKKLFFYSVAGFAGGVLAERLAGPVGEVYNALSEVLTDADVSTEIAACLIRICETSYNSANVLSKLPDQAWDIFLGALFKDGGVFETLLIERVLEELLAKQSVKPIATHAIQYLLTFIDQNQDLIPDQDLLRIRELICDKNVSFA